MDHEESEIALAAVFELTTAPHFPKDEELSEPYITRDNLWLKKHPIARFTEPSAGSGFWTELSEPESLHRKKDQPEWFQPKPNRGWSFVCVPYRDWKMLYSSGLR